MEEVFFSVVIPLYNKEKYIKNTIESVLNQSFTNYEIVVVDDGSTDSSTQIVDGIRSSRIHCVKIENHGVAFARNVGIKNSNGRYITFLDADDMWESSHLQELYLLIERFPESGFFCTNYEIIREQRITQANDIKSGKIGTFWSILKYDNDVVWTSATAVMKSDLIEAGLFNTNDEVGEDLGMWARVAKIKPDVAYSSTCSASYLRSTDNNARKRTKVLYPSDFLNTIQQELSNQSHSSEELDSMKYKYDKKVFVYIISLIVCNQKSKSLTALNNWDNKYFKIQKRMLRVLWVLPLSVSKKMYQMAVSRS